MTSSGLDVSRYERDTIPDIQLVVCRVVYRAFTIEDRSLKDPRYSSKTENLPEAKTISHTSVANN